MGQPQPQGGVIAWFAGNSVAANLLMVIIILSGLYSIYTITKKAMPDINVPLIQVIVPYPGASPSDVESSILRQVEKAVENVEGISAISSVASEGSGQVSLEIDDSFDINLVLDEVQMEVDSILTFPVDAEPPQVLRTQFNSDAIRIEVYGDINPVSQKELAQQIRDELMDIPTITSVSMSGDRAYEISVEVSENTLLKYGLSLDQIAQRIRQSSLDLPAGSLKTGGGEILVRTQSLAYDYKDFERIVLLTTTDGTLLTLGDIAVIKDGFEDSESYARFDGKPSISLNVEATDNQNMLAVTDKVKEYVAEKSRTLPEGIFMDVWSDSSLMLRDRLDLMTSNMLMGALLVFVILALFLELKLALWVMVGLPICFLGAFAVMPIFDLDLNMLSLFGFIMVLGIVVDDAIIIGESVHHSVTKYGHSVDSVVHGALKVATPATFGVLTTIVAFMPLVMISGTVAAFTRSIGLVVVLCLVFSLIESKFILPAHLAHMKRNTGTGWLYRLQKRCNGAFDYFVQNYYLPWNVIAIRNRYVTLSCFIALLIVTGGLIGGGFVRTVFLPEIPADTIRATVTMVEGSPEQQIQATMRKLEEAALSLNGQFEFNDAETNSVSTEVLDHLLIVSSSVSSGSAVLELDKDVASQLDTDLITAYLEKYVGNMPGLKTITFSGGINFGGNPIAFQLVSDNPEQLVAAAGELESKLRTYNGLINIKNEAVNNKDELRLSIKPQAEVMGLTLNDISSQVRNAFYGSQAQRIQRGDDELRVMVRYPEEERVSIGDLEDMYIRTANGDQVPFTSVAEYTMAPGYARINRVEGERSVAISSDIIEAAVEPGQVMNDLDENFFPDLFLRYPAVSYRTDGGTAEQASIISDMIRGMAFAIFGIYALLAVPLRSYTQPLIIMGVIPFGAIGAVFGHWLIGMPLNFMSFLGIIALSGVVVNDSIVVVDFVNSSRKEGMSIFDSVLNAGAARFRAIMLTSLTTFFGLVPILLETSMQAQFLIPMATSLAFGIVFATVITLFLIPSLYVILEDFKMHKDGIDEPLIGVPA